MNPTTTDSLSPVLEVAYLRTRRRWQITLATPIVYLLIAAWLRSTRHLGEAAGPHVYDTAFARDAIAFAAAFCMTGLVVMRLHQRGATRRLRGEPDRALRIWLSDFFLLAIFADTIAFLAFLFAMITGHFGTLLTGGIAAYAGYAIAYPRRDDLRDLDLSRL